MKKEATIFVDQLDFTKSRDGLVPAVIQDVTDGKVLMLAYMSKESLEKSLETGETWFYSRSRGKMWHKGETSGNRQLIKEIFFDCDADSLLIKVEQLGVACHKGYRSCFHNRYQKEKGIEVVAKEKEAPVLPLIIEELFQVIEGRKRDMPEGAYTTYLFKEGLDKILKKLGEEASEVIIASKNRSREEIIYEMADLWYFCFVLLSQQGIHPDDIGRELRKRRN